MPPVLLRLGLADALAFERLHYNNYIYYHIKHIISLYHHLSFLKLAIALYLSLIKSGPM